MVNKYEYKDVKSNFGILFLCISLKMRNFAHIYD